MFKRCPSFDCCFNATEKGSPIDDQSHLNRLSFKVCSGFHPKSTAQISTSQALEPLKATTKCLESVHPFIILGHIALHPRAIILRWRFCGAITSSNTLKNDPLLSSVVEPSLSHSLFLRYQCINGKIILQAIIPACTKLLEQREYDNPINSKISFFLNIKLWS